MKLSWTQKQLLKKTCKQTWIGFAMNIPIVLWVVLLIAIIQHFFPFSSLAKIADNAWGTFLWWIIGSIATWNPINSYIIASEVGNIQEYGLLISVFLITWTTVGIVQIPAESYYFGKKYAILRNILAFIWSFVAGWTIYSLYLLW
jgi:hypothetical protein